MSTKDLKLFDLLDGLEMTKSQYEWLARRFENMTAKEALLFRGAMQIEQPQATCDVMQIANQLEHYELLYGAGNDFALGNFVMEHIFYFDYRKHGQFEWTAPAILFACLLFTLTAPTYVWTILGM